MEPTIHNLLSQLELGSAQRYGDLTVVPVLITGAPRVVYLSMSDALASGELTISEVSAGGSVPELAVVNSSSLPVLLIDGEELVGAKQNRVLNASTMVPAQSRIVLPVSCSEAGRWRHVSPTFFDSGLVAARSVRHRKNLTLSLRLQRSADFLADQGAVWAEIGRLQARRGTVSATQAMRDTFEAHAQAIDECLASLPAVENQVGMFALIGGQVVGFDYVSRPEVYQRLHAKLIKSYAVECVARGTTPSGGGSAESRAESSGAERVAPREAPELVAVATFLAALQTAKESERPSVGLGVDHRLSAADVFGSALVCDDEVVHLAAFPVTIEG